MSIIKSAIFDLQKRDLLGNSIGNEMTDSNSFIRDNAQVIESYIGTPNFARVLNEYSRIIKALVKNEMLAEMQKSIDSINTFYNF